MEERFADLERRLHRAERRLRLTCALGLIGVVVGLLLGAARPAATRPAGSTFRIPFRIVDAQGKTLLQVDTGPLGTWHAAGGTRLRVFDPRGRPTALLVAAEDGGSLSLDTREGKRSIGLFASPFGASLAVRSPASEGIPAATLEADRAGCSFTLSDSRGHPGIRLISSRNSAGLEIRRQDQRVFAAP